MKKSNVLHFWQISFAFLLIGFAQTNLNAQLNFTSASTIDSGANTLTLDLVADDFTDILSCQFTLAWDEDVLVYSTANNYGLPVMGPNNFGSNPDHLLNGKLAFAWFDINVSGVSVGNGTTIFSVVFDILNNEDPLFAIEDCPTEIEVKNINDLDVDLNFNGVLAGGCDGSGNNGSGNDISDWVIEFPADATTVWPGTTIDAGFPALFFNDDELIGISFTDQVFYDEPGFDAKIERTWTAVNWSVVSSPVTNYIIEVPENQLAAPNDDLNGDGSSNDRTFRDSWDGVSFPNEVGADWDGYITYTQTILITEGTIDPCITDVDSPTPYCKTGITVLLQSTTMPPSVEVLASTFDAGSFDNCSNELIFSFSNNPSDESTVFTDADLGTQSVDIWVTDEVGNQDFCTSTVHIVDALPPGGLTVSGFIADAFNSPMEGVTVNCTFGNILYSTTTDANGLYELINLPEGETFTITAEKASNDYESGVTTFDVAKLRCLVLGLEEAEPHQPLASDVNATLGISTFDMVLMNKLILGHDPDFVNVPVWQFASDFGSDNSFSVDASQEIILVDLMDNEFNQNFVGVKAGNLVLENNPNPAYQPSLNLEEIASSNPDQVQIDLTVEDFENFTSTQFALTWDASILEYDSYELVANPPAGNTIWTDANIVDGNLRMIVQDPFMVGSLDLEDGETLLRIIFNILQMGNTEVSFVDDAIFPKIITVNGCDLAGGVFNFTNAPINFISTATDNDLQSTWEARLLPNTTYPGSEVILEIQSEKASDYHLNIFDPTGKLLWTKVILNAAELNQSKINSPNTPGIYYLQILDDNGRNDILKLVVI